MKRIIIPTVAALALAGCSKSPTPEQAAASRSAVRAALATQITYQLEGTASSADITMQTPTGTSQQAGVKIPLTTKAGTVGITYTFQAGDFVYISAQNNDDSGSVTCKIVTESGKVISSNTASGAYAIASCKGSA
jgi:hypothetical protein